MDEHCNITFDFLIGDTGINKHYAISYEDFSKLFNDVYPVIFKSGTKEAKEALKRNFLGGLLNVENPDRMTIYHAVRDNKAFTMDFLDEKTHEHNPKALTREKTIMLYHSIASQPQNE